MRARILLIVLPPLLAALFLGIYLAPNSKEMALMQFNDANSDKSLQTFTSLHSQGDHSISVLAPLVELRLHYGDVDEAIALLESFVADNPQNIEGRKRLAELYKASQRHDEYCRVLEALQNLAPSTETLRELADTYDFLGEYKNEMNALARLVTNSGDKPVEEDYVKLARFYRVEGNRATAIDIMDHLLDTKDYKVSVDAVYLAVQLLLENGDERKALSVAKSSLKNQPVEEKALKLSELFQLSGKVDLAYDVLVPFLSSAEISPQLEQQRVGLLFAQKKFDDIFALLSGQFAKKKLPDALATTLIDLAQKRKDYGLMEAVLRTVHFNEIPVEVLLRYADICIRMNLHDLAQLIKNQIGLDRLKNDEPLLSAMLGIAIADTPEAISALRTLPSDVITLPEERLMVALVFLTHGHATQARPLIDALSITDAFSALDPVEYALLYLEAPEAASKALRRLEAVNVSDAPVELRAKIDQAQLLIRTGLGKTEAVELWLKEHPQQTAEVYDDAFSVAKRYHQKNVAMTIAEWLYRTEPSQAHHELLIDALLSNQRYPEALTYLQQNVGSASKQKISTYIDILSLWAHSAKYKGENRAQMQPYVEFALRHLEHKQKEQHEMAYLLEEIGFRSEAEKLLIDFATGKPFSSKEVSEVLALLGDHPAPEELAWIKNRAAAAVDKERMQWLGHLNDISHPEVVIELLKDQIEKAPPPLADLYLDALVRSHSPKIRDTLENEIEKETNVVRLKRLAMLAEQEDVQEVPEKGWRKVFALAPNDGEALKNVALQEANANHYAAASPLLQRYLKDNPDDYQANYAYAGILQHLKKKSEAKPFYNKALKQLIGIKQKTMQDRWSEAHLLYIDNGLTESAGLFRELIKEYPDNKALRADFAEILLENKQFDEASVILSR